MSFGDKELTNDRPAEYEAGKDVSRSRRNQKAETGGNLPGILITGLFVLVEGWFFLQLLRFKLLPVKYMVLIGAGLLLLAGLVCFLCWSVKKRTKFIIGAVLALLASAGLIIGTGVINKVHGSIKNWEAPTTDAHQTVSMGIYVLKEDTLSAVEELTGSVVGILQTVDRSESEQVLDEIAPKMKEPLQVRTYGSFAEAIKGLYAGEVRAIILNKEFIEVLEGMDEFADVKDKVRLITDYYAERPTQVATLPSDPAASTAEGTDGESTDAPHHGTRSWKIIKPSATETEEQETTESQSVPVYTEELPEGTIGTAPPPTEPPTAGPIQVPEGQEGRIFTVYISGLDTRGGGLPTRGNSDVNILAVVNMNTHHVLLISTPRDFFVPFPTVGGARDKLTHAGYYGVDASIAALRNLYGVDSQYFVRVGFDGVKKLVTALGGVTVYSSYSFTAGGYSFTQGTNHLNGAQALAFARHRRGMEGGDRARGNNQLALLKGIIQKIASPSTLGRLNSVLDAVSSLIQTTIPYDTIAAFSQSALGGDNWTVVHYSVNGYNGMEYSFSVGDTRFVMYPDYGTVSYAQSLIRRVYNGEIVSP